MSDTVEYKVPEKFLKAQEAVARSRAGKAYIEYLEWMLLKWGDLENIADSKDFEARRDAIRMVREGIKDPLTAYVNREVIHKDQEKDGYE